MGKIIFSILLLLPLSGVAEEQKFVNRSEFAEWTLPEQEIFSQGVLEGLYVATVLMEQHKPMILLHLHLTAEELTQELHAGIEPLVVSKIVRVLRERYWYVEETN